MSHFVAQSIKVKPNGEIFCVGDDNNVYPRFIREHKFHGDIRDLFDELINGNVQPVDSADGYKWQFALIRSKNATSMDERYQQFLDALKTPNNGKFILVNKKTNSPWYFVKPKKRGYSYHLVKGQAAILKLYKATVFSNRYNLDIEILD